MGLQQSKDELLYQQASYGNTEGVRALRRAGAGLEWIDREGKTPLMLACTKPDGLPVAKTLIELGADVNAYRPGYHGGTPLHHAAKKGLAPMVNFLLSHGVNFLRVNDDCQTALDLARAKGRANVVHAIENHICLFSGWLREISGPGFLEAIAPQWVSRKVWAVVLPCDHRNPMNFSKLELAIYPDVQAAQTRAVISLWKAKVEDISTNQIDPVVIIFDKSTKTRHKFLSANEGDKQQILWFYNACRGMPQQSMPPPPGPDIFASTTPSAPTSAPEDTDLAMAINASIQSAAAERALHPPNAAFALQGADTGGWGDSDNSTYNGWGPPEGQSIPAQPTHGWAGEPANNSYGGWAALGPVPGTPSQDQMSNIVSTSAVPPTQDLPPPFSAPTPPVYEETFASGAIHYPTVDLSPVDANDSMEVMEPLAGKVGKSSSISRACVMCLDAPVEGACIPCGHMAGCMSCLKEVKAKNWGCPVCRAKIEQVVRLYTV